MAASEGHHIVCRPGSILNERWRVVNELGCGNFAKVYRCEDTKSKNMVAVKIIKKEYARDAVIENSILKALAAKDPLGEKKVVRKLDSFTVQGCPALVFALKGCELKSCKLPVRGTQLRKFVKEMLEALAFLHEEVRMCHTDLKPENILLDTPGGVPEKGIGEGWTIADFGSASFYNPAKPDKDLISTRPYRAPEVVLGLPWTSKADVWSMGCIFFELYYGGRMFEIYDEPSHLLAMTRRIGPLPSAMTRRCLQYHTYFRDNGELRVLPRPNSNVPQRNMRQIITDDPGLLALLSKMMSIDPTRRLSAKEALQHPMFGHSAPPKPILEVKPPVAEPVPAVMSPVAEKKQTAQPTSAAPINDAPKVAAPAVSDKTGAETSSSEPAQPESGHNKYKLAALKYLRMRHQGDATKIKDGAAPPSNHVDPQPSPTPRVVIADPTQRPYPIPAQDVANPPAATPTKVQGDKDVIIARFVATPKLEKKHDALKAAAVNKGPVIYHHKQIAGLGARNPNIPVPQLPPSAKAAALKHNIQLNIINDLQKKNNSAAALMAVAVNKKEGADCRAKVLEKLRDIEMKREKRHGQLHLK